MTELETGGRERNGSLVVVGTGIKLVGQVTLEARAEIEHADRVLYMVADGATARWLERLNGNTVSLHTLYQAGKPRRQTYEQMVEAILEPVRSGERVCAVFYGHPGVFVTPSRRALRQARDEGYRAVMLPGISAEDCLFADLELDPAAHGCQSYEATDFLLRPRRYDVTVPLILWQIGVIGQPGVPGEEPNRRGLAVLVEVLSRDYGPDHEVVVYEGAVYPICDPVIIRLPLTELPGAAFSAIATLYVPPIEQTPVDRAMMERLGLTATNS